MVARISEADAKLLGLPATKAAQSRPVPGKMNRTEAAYAATLELDRISGAIVLYAFDAVKFRIADKCWYTPDFLVVLPDGRVELHEVKGFWREDAIVKVKVAADKYPFRFVAVTKQSRKLGGGWTFREFSRGYR